MKEKLMIDISKSDAKTFNKLNKDILQHVEFLSLPEPKVKILKFISIFYDKNSPLDLKDDFRKRKVAAAEMAGFKRKKGVFEEDDEKLLANRNIHVNLAIIKYCRLQKDIKFSKLKTFVDAYYMALENLTTDDANSDKTIKVIDMLEERIEKVVDEILNRDKSLILHNFLYYEIEGDNIMLRPEDIAEQVENNYAGI